MVLHTVNLIILGVLVAACLVFLVYCILNFFPDEED